MPADLDVLQGSWVITAFEMDGQKMARPTFDGARIVISKKTFTSIATGQTYTGVVELDSSKTPKTIDLVFTAGPQKGTRNVGIYKLSPKQWTLCLATRGTKRPAMFKTSEDSGIALETFQRESAVTRPRKGKTVAEASGPPASKASSADETAAAGAPATALEGEWQMVSAVMDGVAFDDNTVQWCRRITRGALTSVVAGPQTFLKARFTLDDVKCPTTIDYLNFWGKDKGTSQAGIVELGDGVLKICVAAPGKPRPKDFASKKGDGRSFTTWRLV